AWALMGDPQVLLFDEPTAGIDIGGEETIYNLLGNLEKERNLSIIIVTHDLSVVYKFADSVLCLNKKLICYGPPQEALGADSLNVLYGGDVKLYKHEH
ncbi:MAG: metal ABC transporter ATP-binding protein, partial [Patescibacteria group bacterium]